MKQLIKLPIKRIFLIIVFVIVGAVLLFLLRTPSTPKVLSTEPTHNQEGVGLNDEVALVFGRSLSDNEKKKLTIKVSPEFVFDQLWEQEKLKIVSKEALKQATKYSVEVRYQNKVIYAFSFETLLLTQEQLIIEGSKQTADDLAFGQAYKTFIQKYPWYSALPVERKEYRIIYDFEKKAFRIRILVATETKEQEDVLINAALKDIETIGYKGVPSYYVVKE